MDGNSTQTRTHNLANEITDLSDTANDPNYDARGNVTAETTATIRRPMRSPFASAAGSTALPKAPITRFDPRKQVDMAFQSLPVEFPSFGNLVRGRLSGGRRNGLTHSPTAASRRSLRETSRAAGRMSSPARPDSSVLCEKPVTRGPFLMALAHGVTHWSLIPARRGCGRS